MNNKHPGPFQWDGDDLWHFGAGYNDPDDTHYFTGITADARHRKSDRMKYMKRLMAAAPDMLECLQMFAEPGNFRVLDLESEPGRIVVVCDLVENPWDRAS